MYQLTYRLELTKQRLSLLNRECIGDIFWRLEMLEVLIADLHMRKECKGGLLMDNLVALGATCPPINPLVARGLLKIEVKDLVD